MNNYTDMRKKAQAKVRKMSTKKLLEERKGYNAEFKRYSAKVLKERGVKLRKKKPAQRKNDDFFGFGNLWR